MESETPISSIPPKKQYKKISSVANAEKARVGRAKAREALKSRPVSEDEYSEDEIVYVPTKRKTKNTLQVPQQKDLTAEIDDLKKELEKLRMPKAEPTPPSAPIPVQLPKHNPHHDVINMAKSRILNF